MNLCVPQVLFVAAVIGFGTVGAGLGSYIQNGFPNPMVDFSGCGQNTSGYICDPSNTLTENEVGMLNSIIRSLKSNNVCLCADEEECPGFIDHELMIAIVPRIKDTSGQFPQTYEAQKAATRQFAEHLRDGGWAAPSRGCRMRAYIVLDLHTHVVWTATDYFAHLVITDKRATRVGLRAKNTAFIHGLTFSGLQMMLTQYKDFVDEGLPGGLAWWHILLIVVGSVCGVGLLAGCCYCCTKHQRRR